MIRIAVLLLALFQAAPLPPAYPRPGASQLLENDRVRVWDIAWLKQQYPLHRHIYALAGVYYTSGDRTIISTTGTRRPVSTEAWSVVYQDSGVTHIEEGASDAPLKAVFFEFKEPAALGQTDQAAASIAFPRGEGKQVLDNDRTTIWEFAPVPPASSMPHRHTRDAVVVAFTGTTPRASFVKRGTEHTSDVTGPADRLYVFELK
jgi:hypothetical protein